MVLFSRNSIRVLHRLQRSHHTLGIGASRGLAMTSWPTLPDARETFIGEVFSVMREVLGSNVDGDLPVRNLPVRVARMRETIYVFDHDGLDLKRTKLAMTASRKIIAAGFDRDKCGK